MIIVSCRLLGRDTVIEYDKGAPWLSFGFRKEGPWDTVVFLGKLTVIHSNLGQRRCSCLNKLAIVALSTGVAVAAVLPDGGAHILATWVAPTEPR